MTTDHLMFHECIWFVEKVENFFGKSLGIFFETSAREPLGQESHYAIMSQIGQLASDNSRMGKTSTRYAPGVCTLEKMSSTLSARSTNGSRPAGLMV